MKPIVCDNQKDFFDSNGNYLKSACLVGSGLNYEAASAYFKSGGMAVYSITTADEYSEVQKWMTSLYGVGSGAGVWVDGMYTNGQWITSSGKPLFSAAIPTKDLGNGNCVLLSNYYGNFELIAKDCAGTPSSVGEFFDVSKQNLAILVSTVIDPESFPCGLLNFNYSFNYFSKFIFRNIFALRCGKWNQ